MKKLTRTLFVFAIALAAFAALGCVFADGSTAAAAAVDMNKGVSLLAAALAMGGIAVGAGAPAAIGALTEDPKSFGKALIFVALGEGIALYGMLIAILIWTKV